MDIRARRTTGAAVNENDTWKLAPGTIGSAWRIVRD